MASSPAFVAAVQSISIVRGCMLAAVVVALADPIAALLGQPELGWAYRILAAIPLLRRWCHFDVARQQRAMRFGLMIKTDFAGMVGKPSGARSALALAGRLPGHARRCSSSRTPSGPP